LFSSTTTTRPLVPPSNQFIPSNGNPSSITSAASFYKSKARDTPKSVGNLSNSTNVSNALTMMQNKIHHLSDTVLFPWSITNNSTQIDPKSLSKSACKTLRDTKKGNLKCLSS
uniref:Ovule protein n=1 Tax=Schistosoma curassoni TaxID=6186 RepID=A0A183L5L7_9TREM